MIVGYAAIVDPQAVGDAARGVRRALLRRQRRAGRPAGRRSPDLDAIVGAHTVAGDADAIVRVRVEGIEALERMIEQLRRDPKVTRTRTMVALSTLVDRP